jgi:hypothetical protein
MVPIYGRDLLIINPPTNATNAFVIHFDSPPKDYQYYNQNVLKNIVDQLLPFEVGNDTFRPVRVGVVCNIS